MTQDFAKPSTTRKPPGDKRKKGSKGSTANKSKKTSRKKPSRVKNTRETPPTQTNRIKPVLSLIILIVAFSYGLYYLQSIPPTESIDENAPPLSTDTQATKTPEPAQEKAPDARFKFYDLLPKSQVKAPEVDAYQYREKSQQNSYYYLIQTGSFRNKEDAERQKATIAFQGIKTRIEATTSADNKTWYRVKTEPYTNRSKMNSALDKLVSINIEPLVKKIKIDE